MAAYFPQLGPDGLAQYPYRRRRTMRTASVELADGTEWKYFDDQADRTEWLLRYSNLSESEHGALQAFFEQCEGRLKSFRFVDPNRNLLLWSEDLTSDAWVTTGALVVTPGAADPFGGTRASRLSNGGGHALLSQTVGIPARYQSCFSIFVRSGQETVAIYKRSGGAVRVCEVSTGNGWRRVRVAGALEPAEESVEFGVEIGAGAVVDVFGPQVEAQSAPSAYKRSEGESGVFHESRFGDDVLASFAEAPGLYSAEVRIVAM